METLRGPCIPNEYANFNISALTSAGEICRRNKDGLSINDNCLSMHHSRCCIVSSKATRIMPQFWSTLTRPMLAKKLRRERVSD